MKYTPVIICAALMLNLAACAKADTQSDAVISDDAVNSIELNDFPIADASEYTIITLKPEFDVNDPEMVHDKMQTCLDTATADKHHDIPFAESSAEELLIAAGFETTDSHILNSIAYTSDNNPAKILLIRTDDIDYILDALTQYQSEIVSDESLSDNDKSMAEQSIVSNINEYVYFIMTDAAPNDEAEIIRTFM